MSVYCAHFTSTNLNSTLEQKRSDRLNQLSVDRRKATLSPMFTLLAGIKFCSRIDGVRCLQTEWNEIQTNE